MNKEQDYASDTDQSDEDFCPEDLAGESPPSEDDAETSESNDELDEGKEELRKRPYRRKTSNKKINGNKKSKHDDFSDGENTNTSKRTTRRKDNGQTNGNRKNLEKDEMVSDEEDKSRTNVLWADFLKDVNPAEAAKTCKVEDCLNSSDFNGKEASDKMQKDDKSKISLSPKADKTIVTEVVDFAGEEISIQREIDVSSIKENKAAAISATRKQPFSRLMPGAGVKRVVPPTASGSVTGLGSILTQLGKKKKLSVLEKSQMDWNSFKQSEGIDEQLQTFNKGKNGYLEKQDFLQRTDLRQFEIEKNLRQTTRRPF